MLSDEAIRLIEAKIANYRCPICKADHRLVPTPILLSLTMANITQKDGSPATTDFVSVFCRVCGYAMLFLPTTLGLVEGPPSAPAS